MNTSTEILVVGIGTAGSKAAYYFFQRGGLDANQILCFDSDPDTAEITPSLQVLMVPAPPILPVGAEADAARESMHRGLEQNLGNARIMVILTCLGGRTGGFYTQAALQFAKQRKLPAVALAGMPHSFDNDECKFNASTLLSVLRGERFQILALECEELGPFFPNPDPAYAYQQAIRWLAETAHGYLQLFCEPRQQPGGAPEAEQNFDVIPRGIFSGRQHTIFEGKDLDVPTYLRQHLILPKSSK